MKMLLVLEAGDQVVVVHLAARRLAGWLWLLAGWLGRGAGVQGCSGAGERAGLDVPNHHVAERASERPNVGFAQVPWHGWPAPILNQHSQRELSRWQGRQFVKRNSLCQRHLQGKLPKAGMLQVGWLAGWLTGRLAG